MDEPVGSYLREIAEFFLEQRRGSLWLTPRDIALFLDWQAREIPKHIVLRGIRTAFEGTRGPEGLPADPGRSAQFCSSAVLSEWREYRRRMSGMPQAEAAETSAPIAADPREVLELIGKDVNESLSGQMPEGLRAELTGAASRLLGRLAERLTAGEEVSGKAIVESLRKGDRKLLKLLVESLSAEALTQVDATAREELSHFGIYPGGSGYDQAYRNVVSSLVRRKYGLRKLESYDIFFLP